MLRELIGYCNRMEKTQAEMKVALSEIKKNLKEIKRTNNGGDDAKNQINDLEQKEKINIQPEQNEETRIQKKKKMRRGLGTSGTTLSAPTFQPPNHRGARRRRGRTRN